MPFTVTIKETKLPSGKSRAVCEARDSKGVVRGFTRREFAKPLFLMGGAVKEALKAETVAKAERAVASR